MPLSLHIGDCGKRIKTAIDSLSKEQKQDRNATFKAMGDAIESYCEDYVKAVLAQLIIVVPPLPGLGTAPTGGGPTLPGPGPVTIPSGSLE